MKRLALRRGVPEEAIVSDPDGLNTYATLANLHVRNIVAVLSQRKIANTSQEFTGARAVAFMGGCELDLTQADIASSPAVIEAFAMWGGIEIYVPDGWEIIGEVVPVMAGFEIKTVPTSAPRRQLIVRGAALMGGIVVTRRKS